MEIKQITGSLGRNKNNVNRLITDDNRYLVTDAEEKLSVEKPYLQQDVYGYMSDRTSGMHGNITMPTEESIPEYEGPYTITPSEQLQTLSTEGKKTIQDIVVEPIPSNYGLITWNGSTLTVS